MTEPGLDLEAEVQRTLSAWVRRGSEPVVPTQPPAEPPGRALTSPVRSAQPELRAEVSSSGEPLVAEKERRTSLERETEWMGRLKKCRDELGRVYGVVSKLCEGRSALHTALSRTLSAAESCCPSTAYRAFQDDRTLQTVNLGNVYEQELLLPIKDALAQAGEVEALYGLCLRQQTVLDQHTAALRTFLKRNPQYHPDAPRQERKKGLAKLFSNAASRRKQFMQVTHDYEQARQAQGVAQKTFEEEAKRVHEFTAFELQSRMDRCMAAELDTMRRLVNAHSTGDFLIAPPYQSPEGSQGSDPKPVLEGTGYGNLLSLYSTLPDHKRY